MYLDISEVLYFKIKCVCERSELQQKYLFLWSSHRKCYISFLTFYLGPESSKKGNICRRRQVKLKIRARFATLQNSAFA